MILPRIYGAGCLALLQTGYYGGQGRTHAGPIPVVFGGFGESNAGLDGLIELAARRAAATTYGRRLAPVRSDSMHGS
jgi:hypothetical protein